MRYKITIGYDGTHFSGFQMQTGSAVRTVQNELNKVVNQIAKNPSIPIKVIGASRTDAGVHANGQVAHFDLPYDIPAENLYRGLNTLLPRDMIVHHVQIVPEDFHARFDTKGKRYYYRVSTSQFTDPFKRNYTGRFYRKLDVERIKKALPDFIGEHDFASFAAAGNQSVSTIRTVFDAQLIEGPASEEEFRLVFHGNAFLYNQIRIMVGVLLEIGNGRRDEHDILRLFEVKDREQARFTAPASGLYLDEIFY